jgi:transposase
MKDAWITIKNSSPYKGELGLHNSIQFPWFLELNNNLIMQKYFEENTEIIK